MQREDKTNQADDRLPWVEHLPLACLVSYHYITHTHKHRYARAITKRLTTQITINIKIKINHRKKAAGERQREKKKKEKKWYWIEGKCSGRHSNLALHSNHSELVGKWTRQRDATKRCAGDVNNEQGIEVGERNGERKMVRERGGGERGRRENRERENGRKERTSTNECQLSIFNKFPFQFKIISHRANYAIVCVLMRSHSFWARISGIRSVIFCVPINYLYILRRCVRCVCVCALAHRLSWCTVWALSPN